MLYVSTRGQAPELNFEDVLLTGLASDGGLYVPKTLPQFSRKDLQGMAGLSYAELAIKIMYPFVEGEIPLADFQSMVEDAYQQFDHSAVAPLRQLDANDWVLELFHGPTLAFKDFALQLLGRLLDYFLQKRNEKVVIIGATSGDTGSAAIEGCRSCENVDIFILHPYQRVSEVQRRQMTTVLADNVFNIAVKGNFDDCQGMLKQSFADQSFLLGRRRLVAVNSINWARVMAQIVYYFHSAISLGCADRKIAFSVPTGNFGDIYAGYLAKKMGLPISQLIIATNQNDILHRFLSSNDYSKQGLEHTLSPSMDIMVSSNFERLLFDLHDQDGDAIRDLMAEFDNKSSFSIAPERWLQAKELFSSACINDAATCASIADNFRSNEEVLDPHTAIGVAAAKLCKRDAEVPMVTLATAHPAKFPEAIEKAGIDVELSLPPHMAELMSRQERYEVMDNDISTLHLAVQKKLNLSNH